VAVGILCLLTVPSVGSARASAEGNGVGARPAMGWSTWSFVRKDPTLANVEAQARAMVGSGLRRVGYTYVNVDDFWYRCPGPQGPAVDRYGRWVIDAARFPSHKGRNGIEVLANYVHRLGLKFGLYVTPGISKQAVAEDTPIKGTSHTADSIATDVAEDNYNCGGMVGIDYAKPGAQAFIDSWADEFASWGVDYLKLDGVGSGDVGDVAAWSRALRQTGRRIHLELSNSLDIDDASTWKKLSNGWRTGQDIEAYFSTTVSYPLTDWYNVEGRFDQVAEWAPYGGPGGYNDYDSIEVGNGTNDGLTPAQRQTQMSLWALGSSPLILGSDLTHLNSLDRSYLLDRAVISVDQDGIDATRIAETPGSQVFAKTERDGDVVVGLFNTSPSPQVVSTGARSLGLDGATFALDNLWTHRQSDSGTTISAEVPSDGVVLFRVAARRPSVRGDVHPSVTAPPGAGGPTGQARSRRRSLPDGARGSSVTRTSSFGAAHGGRVART
jgi:hypothetical protein